MSNYTQSTNFATKDALSPGDPLKIVRGTEINTEFTNIAVAVATKFDTTALASPGPIGATTPSSFNGTTGTFSGAVSGSTGTFTGNVQMASANGGQLAGLRNSIINGDMAIWQRGTAAITSAANGAFSADRFLLRSSYTGGTTTITQSTGPSQNLRFSTRFTHATATTTVVTGQYYAMRQIIEKSVARMFGNASNVTVSFWYKSNRTGSHACVFDAGFTGAGFTGTTTSGGNTFTVNVADTWEYKSLTFPLVITGNGTNADNLAGALLTIGFADATLSTFSSISVGNYFDVTGVQLEVGPVATPFEQRPIGMELALCQRYFQTYDSVCALVGTTSAVNANTRFLPVPMRALFSITQTTPVGTGGSWVALGSFKAIGQSGTHSVDASTTVLNLSAEL